MIFLTTYALVLPNPFSETCKISHNKPNLLVELNVQLSFSGVAVASNKFNLAQERDFVPLNITALSASQSDAVLKLVLNQSGVVEGNIANISSRVLCTNATPELLDTVASINAMCGRCGGKLDLLLCLYAIIYIHISI